MLVCTNGHDLCYLGVSPNCPYCEIKMTKKTVDNSKFVMVSGIEAKRARLVDLERFLADEKKAKQPAKQYMTDLEFSIRELKLQLPIEAT